MELSSELIAEVRAAALACEELMERMVARGGKELWPLLADVQALQLRPVDATFRKAVDDLDNVFPYWQDKGATWTSRNDKKFLKRLRAAGGSYGSTDDASIHELNSSIHHIRYIYERAVRLSTHQR